MAESEPHSKFAEPWMADGSCLADDAIEYFIPPLDKQAIKQAKIICAGCIVREQCLEFALTNNVSEFEVWGGKDAKQLAKLRKQRN